MNDHPSLLFTAVWLACGAVGFAIFVFDQGYLLVADCIAGLLCLLTGPVFLAVAIHTIFLERIVKPVFTKMPAERVLWRRKGKP